MTESENLRRRSSDASAAAPRDRVPRTLWVGLITVVVYVLLAAGVSNLLVDIVQPGSVAGEFALSHFVALPILIVAGVIFVRWSGWSRDVWTLGDPAAAPARPRRRWLLAVPILLLINPVLGLFATPWGDRPMVFVLTAALGCLMIGFAEELYYRGILRVSIRAHHGEFLTVLLTSLLFGVSHSFGSLTHGVPLPVVAFQVAVTSMNGVMFYAAFLATGRLWVPMLLHALTDFSLYVQSGDSDAAPGHAGMDLGPVSAVVQVALGVFAVVFLISTIREGRRERGVRA
ncbi:CPBP family intramembrane glutamic endopeptidase [Microbacterium sp. 179-I 3D3 NHS]|uniref:CPBP family intramembrane glutamic endopeptidase n=1 Tax=unclassified Microbacterium TaxID=2609290 RepID=UPI0039A14BAE